MSAALELEAEAFLEDHTDLRTETGEARVTRNGFLPLRPLQTSVGTIRVRVPRLRDQSPLSTRETIRYRSALIAPYKRRMTSRDNLPFLILAAMTTGSYTDALRTFSGDPDTLIHPHVIDGLAKQWRRWRALLDTRDLSQKHYTRWWVDGLCDESNGSDAADDVLVVAGKTREGLVELITVGTGNREDPYSWSVLIEDLKVRGIDRPAEVASVTSPIRERALQAFYEIAGTLQFPETCSPVEA